MEKQLETDILIKIDELVEEIKKHPSYKTYLELTNKLKSNKKINDLITEVKKLQREAVKEEVLGKIDNVKELDKRIKECLNQLNEYPLYLDYLDHQTELNEAFQLIKETLEDYFNEKTQ